jgi:hypothetical protein
LLIQSQSKRTGAADKGNGLCSTLVRIVRINALLSRRSAKRLDLYGVICLAVFVLMNIKTLLGYPALTDIYGAGMARQIKEVYTLSAFFALCWLCCGLVWTVKSNSIMWQCSRCQIQDVLHCK